MLLSEIMALVNAGYTKDEIMALVNPAPAPAPSVTLESLAHQMAQLTSAIQANAIANSQLTPTPQPTAESALAEIIRPTFKERGA